MEPPPLSRILEHVKIRTENKEMEVLDIRTTTTLTLNKKLNNFWIDISVLSDLNQMTLGALISINSERRILIVKFLTTTLLVAMNVD